jgi:hypothetical protein
MGRKKTTVYVDEDLLREAKVFGARTGRTDSEVMEAALRRFLGVEVLDRVWSKSDLTEEQAAELVDEAILEARRAR